ncbi:hypothetical protein QTP88_028870 [Uroleucon formosanum]
MTNHRGNWIYRQSSRNRSSEKFEQLTTMFVKNKKICTANKHNISMICNNFNMTLQLAKLELNKRYSTLMSLRNGRVKRGLINAVGEFENWAFGMVDDDAYQQIQKSIKTNSEKYDKTLNIMKKQEMIDALILSKHNILHPIILKNSELFDIMKNIQQTLPIKQALPVDLSMESAIDDLLKLINN